MSPVTGEASPVSSRLPLRHLWLMGAYGFASGLPLPLTGFTLRQWMSESHLSLAIIGLTADIGLPYTLKFLWAPLLDGVRPPFFLARLGRRRGWLLTIQPLLALACLLLALSDPGRAPGLTVAAAVLVAFLSASQDIAIDAWRIEFFPARLQGGALAAYVWGYRAAMLVAVSGAIALAGHLGWHGALALMAVLVGAGTLVTLVAPEAHPTVPPASPGRTLGRAWLARLRDAVTVPLRDFLCRPGATEILAFVLLFKLGEVLAGTMAAPFYHDMGFNRAQVAAALSLPSLAASLAGIGAGGWLVARLGHESRRRTGHAAIDADHTLRALPLGASRALVLTGFMQMASMAMYFALAVSHGDTRVLYAKVVMESFAESMADAAFLTFLSGLCTPALAATQYALLSSLAALGLRTLGGTSGFLAARLGWVWFYGISIFAAVPAMLIMLHLLARRSGCRMQPS